MRASIAITAFLLLFAQPYTATAIITDRQQVVQVTAAAVRHMPVWSRAVSPTVTHIAIVDNYALTIWLVGNAGGSALLKKNKKGVWSVVDVHGSAMDANLLVAWGVPKSIAARLEANLAPVPSPTP